MASYVPPASNQSTTAYQQQQADQYGLSLEDYQQLLADNPPVYNQNSQGGQYGMSAGGSYGQNPQLTSTLATLKAIKDFGLGSGQQQQQAPPPGSTSAAADDPQYNANPLGALGAAATNTGWVNNPNPASSNFDKTSGTSKVPQATVGAVPNAPTGALYNLPTGGVFNKAATPQPTPAPSQIFPSPQATAAQYNPGQAFAMAPQQPVTPPPAAPTSQTPATMAPQQPAGNSGALTSWDQLGSNAGLGYGHNSQSPPPGAGMGSAVSGLAQAANMWQQNNAGGAGWQPSSYAAGATGTTQDLGKAPSGDPGAMNLSGFSKGGGASAASKQAGLALINQASHVGDSMKDIGSWQTQPSAIPSPDDFKNQGAAVTFRR